MARLVEVFFHVHGAVAKGGAGFGMRASRKAASSSAALWATFMPRPPPPAAALISTGYLIFSATSRASSSVSSSPGDPGTSGTPSFSMVVLAVILSPIMRICVGDGPMKAMLMRFHHFGEVGVFRQEAVAGMDCVGAGDKGGGEHCRHFQVAVPACRRSDADALIGQPHMHGVRTSAVEWIATVAMPSSAAGPLHPKRDFPAIGDQYFFEHLTAKTRQHCFQRPQ